MDRQQTTLIGKVKVNRYGSLQPCLTAMKTHMPYGITQCYLPPGRGDIPALNPAESGTQFSDPRGMQGWVDLATAVKVCTARAQDCLSQ